MSEINRSALLPYAVEQIYEIVRDVPSYSSFLPWCESSRILSADSDSMVAELTVVMSGIQKSFTTRNSLFPTERIELELVSGPFKSLSGSWYFTTLGSEGCSSVSKSTLELRGQCCRKSLSEPPTHLLMRSLTGQMSSMVVMLKIQVVFASPENQLVIDLEVR